MHGLAGKGRLGNDMYDIFWKNRTELDALPLKEKLAAMDAVKQRTSKRTWALRISSNPQLLSIYLMPLALLVARRPWMVYAGLALFLVAIAAQGVLFAFVFKQSQSLIGKVYEEEYAEELRQRGLAKTPPGGG